MPTQIFNLLRISQREIYDRESVYFIVKLIGITSFARSCWFKRNFRSSHFSVYYYSRKLSYVIFPSVPLACISAERRRQSSKNSRYNVVRLCLRLSNKFASSRLFFSTKRCICIRAASCIQCLLLRHPVTGEFHVDWVIVIKSIVIWMSISISKEELRVLFKTSWLIDDEITRASSHL